MTGNLGFWFAMGFLMVVLTEGAPRSHSRNKNKGRDGPHLVYDQKQTGDYNIQVHLKDFQIIALLGDDAMGDYEYDYDYSDFTVKPSTSTTPKPSTTTTTTTKPSSTTSTKPPSTTTQQPSTTTPTAYSLKPRPSEVPVVISSTNSPSSSKPPNTMMSNAQPFPLVVVLEPTKKPITENKTFITSDNAVEEPLLKENGTETAFSLRFSSPKPDSMPLDKIKVQIVESPSSNSLPLGIVPGEDVQSDSGEALHGEVASYRKCASGFSRDKKGRCRRVRKPAVSSQLPFGFGRLASNLATRLRLPMQSSEGELPLRSV